MWAQAAEKAGSLELEAMIASLRQHQFDTVLGPIDFDEKGDVTLQNPVLCLGGLVRQPVAEQDEDRVGSGRCSFRKDDERGRIGSREGPCWPGARPPCSVSASAGACCWLSSASARSR